MDPLKGITQKELKTLIRYDHVNGSFERIKNRRSDVLGPIKGSRLNNGHVVFRLKMNKCLAHRVAFLYMTGSVPDCIDHINGDPSDNRWVNLRACTMRQNQGNRRLNKNSSTGYKGVRINKNTGKFMAKINYKEKVIHIGTYKTAFEAHQAYVQASKTIFGEFHNDGFNDSK
jgi:hypothetical protein